MVAEAGFEHLQREGWVGDVIPGAVPDTAFAAKAAWRLSTASLACPLAVSPAGRARARDPTSAARRSHNPSVAASSILPTDKQKQHPVGAVFCLVAEAGFEPTTSGL